MCVCYLSRQQCVGVESLHAADQLVSGVDHIVHKRPVDQEPIRAPVHRNALWDLAVPETPHVGVTLVEEAVQTLLTDETERTHRVQCLTDYCVSHFKYYHMDTSLLPHCRERDRWTLFL